MQYNLRETTQSKMHFVVNTPTKCPHRPIKKHYGEKFLIAAFIHRFLRAVSGKYPNHPITKSDLLCHIHTFHQKALANNFFKGKTTKILNNIFLFSLPLSQSLILKNKNFTQHGLSKIHLLPLMGFISLSSISVFYSVTGL